MKGSVFILRAKKDNNKSKKQLDIKNIIIKILTGSLFNFLILSILVVLSAKMILKNPIDLKSYKFIMLICILISSFAGGFISSRPIKKNGIFVGAISSLPIVLIIVLSVLLTSSKISYILPMIILFEIAFSSLGGIVGVNLKKLKR